MWLDPLASGSFPLAHGSGDVEVLGELTNSSKPPMLQELKEVPGSSLYDSTLLESPWVPDATAPHYVLESTTLDEKSPFI